MTVTITPAPVAGGAGPAVAPMTSSLPKAPQSILVVGSTPYGKVLPAAGPVDDEIKSHFWDQYLPNNGGAPKSSSSPVTLHFPPLFSMPSALWAILVVYGFLSA
ncbi:hypothetical protein BGX29_005440 [Mortierella sp. GBA35]|nr:hypothetical protein BGX29_005440 [Mortierella sp. GBA35]